jgi:hypothetical protein
VKRRKPKRAKKETPSHFGLERSILNGGIAAGMLAMLIDVVWFVVGIMNDRIFFYPPVLFVVGFVAFIKGLAGGSD